MDPVNEYLGPFYEHIFSEFISRGWLRLLYGGADVGGYLAHHPKVDTIHMTGSAATYDAIVWGTDDQAASRKANNTPLLDKPITGELGGVSPFIVVPGDWGPATCGSKPNISPRPNSSTPATTATPHRYSSSRRTGHWPTNSSPKSALSSATPNPPPYYPRSEDKITSACRGMTGTEFLGGDHTRALITDVDAHSGASILTDEVFAGVLGV